MRRETPTHVIAAAARVLGCDVASLLAMADPSTCGWKLAAGKVAAVVVMRDRLGMGWSEIGRAMGYASARGAKRRYADRAEHAATVAAVIAHLDRMGLRPMSRARRKAGDRFLASRKAAA